MEIKDYVKFLAREPNRQIDMSLFSFLPVE